MIRGKQISIDTVPVSFGLGNSNLEGLTEALDFYIRNTVGFSPIRITDFTGSTILSVQNATLSLVDDHAFIKANPTAGNWGVVIEPIMMTSYTDMITPSSIALRGTFVHHSNNMRIGVTFEENAAQFGTVDKRAVFEIDSSGDVFCITHNGSNGTSTDVTGVFPADGTIMTIQINIDYVAGTTLFFLNGELLASHSTNLVTLDDDKRHVLFGIGGTDALTANNNTHLGAFSYKVNF